MNFSEVREAWLNALARIESLNPDVVIPGHHSGNGQMKFVPTKAPQGVQNRAPAPLNPGWIQGVGNAVLHVLQGFPGGLVPEPPTGLRCHA